MLSMLLIMLYIVDVVVEPILNILPSLASQPRVVSPFSKWRSSFEYLNFTIEPILSILPSLASHPHDVIPFSKQRSAFDYLWQSMARVYKKIRFDRIVRRLQSLLCRYPRCHHWLHLCSSSYNLFARRCSQSILHWYLRFSLRCCLRSSSYDFFL